MPVTDPFEVMRRVRAPATSDDDVPDDGSGPLPPETDDMPTTYSVARNQQIQQASSVFAAVQKQQAAQAVANQKAQAAQDKIDQQNVQQQAMADSANRKAAGVVTKDESFVGPDGKAYNEQMPTANPDGTTAYKPADLGIQTTDDGSPYIVSRNKWGAQQWDNPYGPANANLKVTPMDAQGNGGGAIMATPKGKGASALPQKDVTMQGVTGLDAVDAQGNPDPSQLKVDPNAPINQPQVQSQIGEEEQKLIREAAAQRVKDTVGKDAADAKQALDAATSDHADAVDAARMAADAKGNLLAPGYDPIKAATDLQAAQQDAIAKAQAKNDAKRNFDAKDAEHKKALLDPVAYLQNQSTADTSDLQSQQQPPATPSPSGTAQPSASGSPQSTPTPDWPATLPSEWQNMTSAQLAKLNPPKGQENAWAQAYQLKVSQEVSAQSPQPPPNPPVTSAATDPSQSAGTTPTDPNSITGLITGTYGQQPGSQPTVDAQGNPAPTGPAQKGTWGSWLSNVKTKSLALFGSSIGDIMKGVGDVTDLEAAPEKFLENHVTAPLAKSFMSPANYQKYLDRINAPNLITAAGDQIKANADALASGGVGLQLPNLGPLKGPTLQVDPNRKDLGTSVISGAAGMIPMVAGGEFETPLWINSGYQNAVDEAKKNGDSPLVTQAKGIVGAVTMGGVSKLFSAFGAPASKFFNPVLWGGRETADSTTNPILQVLQGGAKATTANVLAQIAKLAGKGGVEGAGFSVGGQVASGDNPYAPSDAAKNTSDDLSSAGSLAALQAVLGTFTHGKTLHQISKGVDDLVSQANDARTNPPEGQPPQPPLDRATVLAGLIHQNQVARAQDSFASLQKQYGALDSNDSLTPQQRLGEKVKAVAQVPAELRSAVVAHLDAAADAQRQTDEAMKAADAEQAKLPPTTPELGRRPDAYIQANQQDILQSQQTGQPRQRQLIGNETDADILAEAVRRQKLADLANQRSQVVAGIAGNLKDSLDQTVSLAGTPEGRSALLSLNRYNASQPTGTPKASATTLQNAMDLAPRPAGDLSLPSVYVEHYLPLAHQIEQLGDPDQKVMATAATKLTNGRALTDDERTLLLGAPDGSQPAAVTPEGQPFAKVEGQRPILTDAGLARLKTLVPAASEVLPRSEQTQLEAQPPPLPKGGKAPAQPPPLNKPLTSQISGVNLSKPDPALSNVDDETLQVQHGSVTAAIAKAKANGGDSPPTVYAHRDRLATEMARRQAAIQPAESNPLGAPAGAKEGDEISYTRPTREGQTVQTRGEVTQVGPDHYRVVDAHDGVERSVPIHARPAPVETKQAPGETKPVLDGTKAAKPETTNPRLVSAIEASMGGRRMELTDNLRQQKLSVYTGDSSAGNMTVQDAIDQGYLHEFNEDGKIFVRQSRPEDKAERPPGQKEKTAQQAEAVGKAQQQQLAHNAVQEHLDGKISRIQLNDRLRNLGMTNDEIEQTVQQHDGTNLPGIDPTTIRPEHRATAAILSNAFNRFQRLLTDLGLARFKEVSAPEGTIGLGVDPTDLNHIVLDLPRLADNLDHLPTPAARQARVDKVIREEIIHKTGREILGKDADSTYIRIWRQMSPEKQEATLRTYDNGAILPDDPNYQGKKGSGFLRGASEAQKGEEAFRQMVDLYLDGNVTELAGRVTPESRGLLQRIQDYLKKILTPGDRETANLVKTVGDLIKLHDDNLGGEDSLDMSPPKDEPSPSPNGNGRHPADIAMSNGETLPSRYELAELGSLSPSHRNGSPNPDYPHGLNERDYSLPEEKQKNEAMANGFDPRRVVTDNPDAVNGPPIVDKNGLVLGGNRRTILLSDPRAYAKYRPYLQANADRFGLKPDDVAKMQQPVLVRRVDASDAQRPELIRRLNEVPTGGIDTANDAVSAGKQITPDLVKSVSDLFQQDPDKTPLQHLSDGDTKAIAQGLLDAGAIRPNDKEKYVGANGNLTPEGARFARSVLLGGVLPDAALLREISDTPTETKLLNGLSPLYTMKARGADITPLREAVTLEADRQRLGIKNVAEHQTQGNLAGIGQEATAQGKTLQSFLAGIKGNEARRAFTQLQNLVSPLEPGQAGLFGEKNRKSIADVTDAEMNQVIKSSKRITKAAESLRNVLGGAEIKDEPVRYPGPLPMEGMPGLNPIQRSVEAEFAQRVQADLEGTARAYAKLPDSEGGRVIDMDELRRLDPNYNASRASRTRLSVATQKVVNALTVHELLPRAGATLRPGDTMGLTAGGPGSGKGALKHILETEWYGAKFVYDGVLRKADFANGMIADAAARGARTSIWYVHVPVEKAVEQAIDRAVTDGRSLPIDVLATGHWDAQGTMRQLLRQHASNPNVDLAVIDNSGPRGTAKRVSDPLAFLQKQGIVYRDPDEVKARARQALEANIHRLTDPAAREIFRTGTYTPSDRELQEFAEQRGGRGLRGGDESPVRPVAGAAVRDTQTPSLFDQDSASSRNEAEIPRNAEVPESKQGALKAYKTLTALKAAGTKLSASQEQTLEKAERALGQQFIPGTESLTPREQRQQQIMERRREAKKEIVAQPPEPNITAPKWAAAMTGRDKDQSLFDTGQDVQRGQSLLFGGAITSDEPTGYEKVPDSLMGYAKSEDRNKSFEDSNYPHGYNVKVDFKDGSAPFEDGMRGMNPKHALERAKRNWDGAHITLDASTPIFGGAVADHPDVEKPLARYVAALRQGELNLDKPVDFAREYETDMGQPAPATLIDRAKELEAQPGQDEGATPELRFSNHLAMADRLASAFHNIHGIEPDDARQVARTALATAADGYDPSRGVPFRGYASAVIRNGLRDLYRYQARRAVEQPTLDAPVSRDKEGLEATGKDYVQSSEPTASQQAARNDAHARLRDFIDRVSMADGSREAIRGLLAGKTNIEIAQEQGVTPQRISAAVGMGLEKLRAALADRNLTRGDFLGGAAVHPDVDDAGLRTYVESHGIQDPQAAQSIKEAFAQSNLPGFERPYVDRRAGPDAVQRQAGPADEAGRAQVLKTPTDTAALRQAFSTGETISSLLPKYVGGRIPAFDLRGKVVRTPSDFAKLAWAVRSPYVETVKLAVLNNRGKIVHSEVLHVGGLNESLFDLKAVMQAVQGVPNAKRVLIAHNHPSGNPTPSSEDQMMTRRLEAVLRQAGMELVDHVITNGRTFTSAKTGWGTEQIPGGGPAAWEAVPREDLPHVDNATKFASVADALRQSGPDHTHAVYLSTKHTIIGMERMPRNQAYADLLSKLTNGVSREGAANVMLAGHDLDPAEARQLQKDLKGVAPLLDVSTIAHPSFEQAGLLGESGVDYQPRQGRAVGGAEIPPGKVDLGDNSFSDMKEGFDPKDPDTWPIDSEAAEAIKERTGDLGDYDEGNALNDAIENMENNGWPQAVIDKAHQARDAMQKHLDERTAAVEEQGNAWGKWLDNPHREIAYTTPDVDDTDTWPAKAQQAWEKLDTGDPETWPKGLMEDAKAAGELTEYDHDEGEPEEDRTPPDVDQDFAQQWMHEHLAEPEWLSHVNKLPEGQDILDKAAQDQRDAEIHAEGEARTASSPVGKELGRRSDERDAVRRELTKKYGIDGGYLTSYGKPEGTWHARDYGTRDEAKSVPMSDEDSVRARNAEDAYQQAREKSLATEKAHRADVAREMAGKPLRDFRKAGAGKPEQGTLFGAGVMDAPTDTNHSPKDGFAIENYREPDPAHEKHLLDELPSADRARAQIAEKFLGIPIKATIDRIPLDSDIQKGAELLHNVKDQALKVLAPQVRTDQAGLAGELYSHRAAEYRLMRSQAIEAVKSARAMIDRKGKNALDFTLSIARAIESDTPHPDPEARAIVDLFTAVNNRFRDMVRSLPGTHFRNYILDYFPHSFTERDQAKAAKFYERKLQGSTAFVKHRSIPTIQEAYEAGLHLKSDNAADLFLMKWDEMLRYKMGQDYLSDLKENNLARPFDSDAAAPAGWSQIDSRIGKSTVSVPAHRDTPGAYEVKNSQVPLPGMPAEKTYGVDKAIHYYAPDSVAQVLNNHLAPGLSDYAWYKGSMMLANTLNQANLGFSAFHLGFVTCDSMISKQADAMESLIRDKDPVAAAKKLAQAYTPGVAPIMAYLSGNKLMKAALAPGTSENSELNAMIDAVTKGGGDVKRGEIYSNGWVKAMLQNWRKGTATGYAQAGIRFPAALIELAAHPILGHIVPRVKLGVFMDMARRELRRLGPDASHQDTLKALQGVWASVDNRLGEFAYDNLHMHQGAKHVVFLAIRSVGWDLGTARELGLGTLDAARMGKNLISGKGSVDDFTHRLAYTISLPMMLGAYGALATYLATGKAPQDIRDYFFPPTGEIDPYGHKMRFAPPTYGKDVAGFFHQPGQTLVNKLNPIWSNMFSIFQNRDFWGNQIYSPDDPAYKKGAEMLRYEAGAFEPFALSGYIQNRKMGVGVAKSIAPFFGLTPAASWIDKSPAEERAQELENRLHAGEVKNSDEAASYQKYLALRNQFAQNDPLAGATADEKAKAQKALANPNLTPSDKAAAQNTLAKPDMTPEERLHRQLTNSTALRQAIQDGTIKPSEVGKLVEDARKPPLQRMFDGIVEKFQKSGDSKNAYTQAKSIWDLATPQEQKLLFPKMVNVWATAMTNRLTQDPKPINPTAPKPAPALAGAATKN